MSFVGSALGIEDGQLNKGVATVNIPYKDSRANTQTSYVRVIVVFVFLLVLIGVVVLVLSRTSLHKKLSAFPGQRIRIIETKRVFPKLNLYLVSIDEKEYLLAQSGDGISLMRHSYGEQYKGEDSND